MTEEIPARDRTVGGWMKTQCQPDSNRIKIQHNIKVSFENSNVIRIDPFIFALLGFGRIGQMHAENINKNKHLRLLYVYEKVDQLCKKAKNLYKVAKKRKISQRVFWKDVKSLRKESLPIV